MTGIKRVAVYAGSFDPVTYGHVDVITRAARLFDELHVVAGISAEKQTLFNDEERVQMLAACCSHLGNVIVDKHSGLTVDFAKNVAAMVLIRGLRSGADYTYERSMAQMNRHLAENLETIFIPTNPKYFHISSTQVKDVAKHGGDLSSLVPALVAEKLAEKLKG